ncbi:MAG TPA: hypothetical protein VII63_12520 [Caulobacteraceae bacterium]
MKLTTIALTLAAFAIGAPAANAGGWGGRYGVTTQSSEETSTSWSYRSTQTVEGCRAAMDNSRADRREVPRCEEAGEVRLPALFFAGDGGVGPFPDFGGGGGGGGFVLAGGGASAFASDSASARVSVRVNIHGHGGGHGGCGCR